MPFFMHLHVHHFLSIKSCINRFCSIFRIINKNKNNNARGEGEGGSGSGGGGGRISDDEEVSMCMVCWLVFFMVAVILLLYFFYDVMSKS